MENSLSIFIYAISWLTSVSEEVMKLYKVEIITFQYYLEKCMSIKAISTSSADSISSYSPLPYFHLKETSNDVVDGFFSVTRSSEMPEYLSTKITFPGSLNLYCLPELLPSRQIMPLTTSSRGAQVSNTIARVYSSILKKRSSYSSYISDSSIQFSSKNEG